MNSIIIPNKISWSMDLSGEWENNWSKRSLKNVVKKYSQWSDLISMEVLYSSAIKNIFYPFYQKTVMLKDDYRLDPEIVKLFIDKVSLSSEYQLLWFTSKIDGTVIGGNVIHVLPDVVKGVYRAFDHEYTKIHDMSSFDYYADYVVQKYTVSLGISRLNRGLMGHPCTRLGLSMFKVRTGARPRLAKNMLTTEYSDKQIDEIISKNKIFAYFDSPDESGQYKRLTVITRKLSEEIFNEIGDTLEKIGIEVIVKKL